MCLRSWESATAPGRLGTPPTRSSAEGSQAPAFSSENFCPLILEPNLKGVASAGGARVAPLPGPGLDIELPAGVLGPPEAVYQ